MVSSPTVATVAMVAKVSSRLATDRNRPTASHQATTRPLLAMDNNPMAASSNPTAASSLTVATVSSRLTASRLAMVSSHMAATTEATAMLSTEQTYKRIRK